jgi:hypothetical protein
VRSCCSLSASYLCAPVAATHHIPQTRPHHAPQLNTQPLHTSHRCCPWLQSVASQHAHSSRPDTQQSVTGRGEADCATPQGTHCAAFQLHCCVGGGTANNPVVHAQPTTTAERLQGQAETAGAGVTPAARRHTQLQHPLLACCVLLTHPAALQARAAAAPAAVQLMQPIRDNSAAARRGTFSSFLWQLLATGTEWPCHLSAHQHASVPITHTTPNPHTLLRRF